MPIDEYRKLSEMITEAKSIAVLSGAGISTASGIPDIRGEHGAMRDADLIRKYKNDYETIVSHSFFMVHTDQFYDYYKHEMIHREAMPNPAHLYLAELAEKKDVTIITQNIDGLHQKAGSKNVIELHGSILRNHCMNCHEEYNLDHILNEKGVPRCKKCHGVIKPDVVLFEEPLDETMLSEAIGAIQRADLLLIIGSSLIVQPAASLPYYFISHNIAIINRDTTPLDKYAKLVMRDDIIDVFSYLREERQ